MARTTIQVESDLLEQLHSIKQELDAKSYDATIRELIREHRRPRTSAFGSLPDLPPFERDELDRLD